jgi:hypothetical protein
VQESSGRAELQEHALAKLKARERGASLGPMVTPYSSCRPHDCTPSTGVKDILSHTIFSVAQKLHKV